MSKQMRRNADFDPEECSTTEARGHVIDRLNALENLIDILLIRAAMPQNPGAFRSLFLSSSIMDFSKKIKILKNCLGVTKTINNSFHELMSIRNAFAHANIISKSEVKPRENDKWTEALPPFVVTMTDVIEKGSNNGIQIVPAKTLLWEFIKHHKSCESFLLAEIKKLGDNIDSGKH